MTPAEKSAAIAGAAERLKLRASDVAHYAHAVLGWARAGFPARTDDQVETIWQLHCRPCPEHVDGRCRACRCRVDGKAQALTNKIRMATEHCPKGNW